MARYIQKISLIPYSPQEMWVGWDLEGMDGEIPGLVFAESLSDADLRQRGVREFQKIPKEYVGDVRTDLQGGSAPQPRA